MFYQHIYDDPDCIFIADPYDRDARPGDVAMDRSIKYLENKQRDGERCVQLGGFAEIERERAREREKKRGYLPDYAKNPAANHAKNQRNVKRKRVQGANEMKRAFIAPHTKAKEKSIFVRDLERDIELDYEMDGAAGEANKMRDKRKKKTPQQERRSVAKTRRDRPGHEGRRSRVFRGATGHERCRQEEAGVVRHMAPYTEKGTAFDSRSKAARRSRVDHADQDCPRRRQRLPLQNPARRPVFR